MPASGIVDSLHAGGIGCPDSSPLNCCQGLILPGDNPNLQTVSRAIQQLNFVDSSPLKNRLSMRHREPSPAPAGNLPWRLQAGGPRACTH